MDKTNLKQLTFSASPLYVYSCFNIFLQFSINSLKEIPPMGNFSILAQKEKKSAKHLQTSVISEELYSG